MGKISTMNNKSEMYNTQNNDCGCDVLLNNLNNEEEHIE